MKQMVGNDWIRIGLTAFASGLCMSAEASGIVNGSWRDFGVENPDTVISLNCQELLANANTPLFYADFRKNFPNSLQVRNGEIKNLTISGEGLEHLQDFFLLDIDFMLSFGRYCAYERGMV